MRDRKKQCSYKRIEMKRERQIKRMREQEQESEKEKERVKETESNYLQEGKQWNIYVANEIAGGAIC